MPPEKPNPNPGGKKLMAEIFLHIGNYGRESLKRRGNKAISTGCQTTGCGERKATNGVSEVNHAIFKKAVGKNFEGKYYLRPKVNSYEVCFYIFNDCYIVMFL